MENSQLIILSGIKEMISSMYREIHELENKLGEIEIQVDKALGVENVAVNLDYVPIADIEEDTSVVPDPVEDAEPAGKSESEDVVPVQESVSEAAVPYQESLSETTEGVGPDRECVAEMTEAEDAVEEMAEKEDAVEENESGKALLAEELERNGRPVVMDVMKPKEPWRIDRPGTPLKDIRSAISLNDRVLFINYLFREDPSLFIDTVSVFNSMEMLDEAVGYIRANFPEWDMQSEVVYRFMMAVRRKLR